jgi:hypothetical protein
MPFGWACRQGPAFPDRRFLRGVPVRDANFEGVMQSSGFRAKRLATGLAVIGLVAGVVAACVELEGSLGSDCLKNQDCQSGVCSQLRCVAVPPLLDAEPEPGPDAADAAADAPQATQPPVDGSGATMDGTAPTDATQPTGDAVPSDTGSVVPVDAPADAIDEGPTPDASSTDAPADAPDDARQDAGEAG